MHKTGKAILDKSSIKNRIFGDKADDAFMDSKTPFKSNPMANKAKNSLNSKEIKYPNNGKIIF